MASWTRAGAISGLSRAGSAGRSRGAIVAGLAWQGAAVVAPLLVRHAVDARHRPPTTARALWWACGGIAVLGARRGDRRRRAPLLRDPEPRARRRRRPRRDLPPRARARRALPRPRRRGRADLPRLERRASWSPASSTRSGTRSATSSRSSASRRCCSSSTGGSRSRCSCRCRCVSIGFGRYSRRYAERTRVNQEELGELTALAEETIAGIRVVKGLGAGDALVCALPRPLRPRRRDLPRRRATSTPCSCPRSKRCRWSGSSSCSGTARTA